MGVSAADHNFLQLDEQELWEADALFTTSLGLAYNEQNGILYEVGALR